MPTSSVRQSTQRYSDERAGGTVHSVRGRRRAGGTTARRATSRPSPNSFVATTSPCSGGALLRRSQRRAPRTSPRTPGSRSFAASSASRAAAPSRPGCCGSAPIAPRTVAVKEHRIDPGRPHHRRTHGRLAAIRRGRRLDRPPVPFSEASNRASTTRRSCRRGARRRSRRWASPSRRS